MDNFKVADGRAEFEIQVRAGQPPQAEPGGISEDKASDGSFTSLGNIGRLVGVYIHFDKAAFSGALSIFETACTRTSLGVFSSWNTTDANHFENVTNTTHINGLTAPASTAFFPEALILANRFPGPSEDFLPVFRWSCPVTASNNDGPARLALEGRSFSQAEQLTGAGSQSETYSMVADNNLWYYPLDSTPSIVNAELGNAQLADGFYIDLWFSEGVYGAPSGATTITPVTAGAFNFLQAQDVSYPAKSPVSDPTVNDTRAMAAPSKVSKPDGGVLAGGETVIRLHYPSDQHPGALFGASELTEEFTIGIQPPASGKTIVDADGNELHGGTDWHMQVFYDRFAPHINRATVGPRSRYIDVTLNKNAKFGIRYNNDDKSTPVITNVAPSPADFVIIHYDSSESTERRLSPSAIQTHDGEDMFGRTFDEGLQALRLVMPDGVYTSDDRVDIRIAEQVKDLRYPSLASVFDVSQKKGTSQFPRTAAPAQVGGLQLRGRERYSIAFTQVLTDQANNLGLITATTLPDSPIENPNIVDEGNDADEGTLWGVLISRPESDAGDVSTIRLSLLREVGPADNSGVSWGHKALGATAFSEVSVDIPEDLIFAAGESAKLFVIRLAENTDTGTGNRRYKIEISVTDTDAQAIEGAASVTVGTNEDDDPPLKLELGDDGRSRTPVSEDRLQDATFALQVVGGALRVIPDDVSVTLDEFGDPTPDGVTDISIVVYLTDASGSIIDFGETRAMSRHLSPLNRPVDDREIITVGGVQYQIELPGALIREPGGGVRASGAMTAVVVGDTPATHAQTLAFLRALRFKLTEDDDDLVDTNAQFDIALAPPIGPGINPRIATAIYYIPILATNDIEYTVAATETSIVEDASLSADSPHILRILRDYDVVETGDTVLPPQIFGVTNVNEGSSGGQLFASNDAGISTSCDEVTGKCVVSFGESPIANRWGTLTFNVAVVDSSGTDGKGTVIPNADGAPMVFTLRVAPGNDAPEFSAPDVAPLAALEEDGSALKVILEGTNGPEESGTPAFTIEARTGVFGLTRLSLTSISGNELTIDPSQVGNACGEGTLTISARESGINGDPAPFNSGGALGTSERVASIAIACTNDPMAIALDPAEDIDVPVGGSTTLAFALSDPDWVNGRYIGRADEIIARGGILTVKLQEGSEDPSALAAAGVDIDFVESDDLTVEAAGTAPDLAPDDPFGHSHGKFNISVSGTRVGSVTRQRVSDVQTFEGDDSDTAVLNRTHFLKIEIDETDVRRGLFEKLINLIEVSSHDHDPYPEVSDRTIVVEFEEADNDRARGLAGSAEVVNTATLPQKINMLGDPPAFLRVSPNSDGDFTESNLQMQSSGVAIVGEVEIGDRNPPGIADDRLALITIGMVFENGGVPQSLTDNLLIKRNEEAGFVPLVSETSVSVGGFGDRRNYNGRIISGRLEFSTGVLGEDASWFKTLLTERLRFKLAADQNDPGATVRFDFTAIPSAGASINLTPAETFVTYTITPQNDPPTGVVQEIPAVDEILPGADAYRTTIISNLSPVERDQIVLEGRHFTLFGRSAQVGNPGISGNPGELVAELVARSRPRLDGEDVTFTYTPQPYRHGTLTFSLRIGDSGGGATTDFGPFTATINPVDNEPEITAPVAVTYDEGAARLIELSGISNGPDEQPASATHPVGMSASISGFLDQDGLAFNVGGQNLRVVGSSVPVTQVTTSMDITGLPDSNGAATITFTATDGTADSGIAGGDTGLSATRDVGVIINPVNDAPVLARAPGAPFSVAPGEATTLKATITDPDIQARLAGFSPGSSELGYRAGSSLTVALDEGSRNAEVDSKAVNIRLVDVLQADGEGFEVDGVVVDDTVVNGVSLIVSRFVSADDLTIRVSRTGVGLIGQIRVTRSTPLAVTTGDNRQILRADVISDNLRQEAMNAFLQAAIEISIDGTDTSIKQDRVVEISFGDAGNDGERGDAGPPKPSNQLAFALASDPVPIITFSAGTLVAFLTEDELKQPRPMIFGDRYGNVTITDVNEDTTNLDPGTASGGSHGAAIASIQVVASAGANGALPDPTWVTDALPLGFSATPNGLAVTLTPTGASTLTSTDDAQAALRALSFRIADGNEDPPETITFEVTLRPVQGVAGINPTNAVGTYTVDVFEINDPPTVDLVKDTVEQDEDDPDGLANTVIIIGSADAIETGQALQQGAARVDASLASSPNNVDGGFESLFTTLPSVNVSRTAIQVTHGTPASGKYGTVGYSFTIQDAGGGDDTSEPFSFTYQVRPVADPIVVTVSGVRDPDLEGTQSLQSTASLTVADGPEENDNISVSVTSFELRRNGDGDRGRSISGADAFAQLANFRMSVDVSGDSTREETLTGVGGDGFEVSSGAILGLLGDLKDGLENFNGIGELRVELMDVPGQDGIQGPGTERSFFLSIAARDDPLELELPEFLVVNAGTSETFIRGVSDPDVDPIALVGVGGGTLAGNNAPYLRDGDTLIVKISAPADASAADKEAVARENSVGVVDNTGAVSLVGEELRYLSDAVGNVKTGRDGSAGVVTPTITFTRSLSSSTATAVLEALAIVVTADSTYSQERDVEVTWVTSRNDGADGLGDGNTGRVSTTETFTMTGDEIPPTLPSDMNVKVETAVTTATLSWVPAQDRVTEGGKIVQAEDGSPYGGLRYRVVIMEEGSTFSQTVTFDEAPYEDDKYRTHDAGGGGAGYVLIKEGEGEGRRAEFQITRANAVLIPGRTYEFQLTATDRAGNPQDGALKYDPVSEKMKTGVVDDNDNGIHDELDAVIAAGGGLERYCGGDEFAVGSDGVPNRVEVRIGRDCRDRDFFSRNDQVPGEPEFGDIAGRRVAGTGPITRVELTAPECTNCGTPTAYISSATVTVPYTENDSGCTTRSGRAGVSGPDNPCQAADEDGDGYVLLGSFTRNILWVAENEFGWASAVEAIYVEPPVGFDLSMQTAAAGSMNVSLPVSVAVSDDVLSSGFMFEVEVGLEKAGDAQLTLDQDNTNGVVEAILSSPLTTQEVTLAIVPASFTHDFVLANKTVEVKVFERPASEVVFGFGGRSLPLYVRPDGTFLPRGSDELISLTFTVSSEVSGGSFMVNIRRHRGDESPSSVSSKTVTAGATVDLSEEIGSSGTAIEVGDTIEVRASTTTDNFVEGRFIVVVVDGATDVNGNGVPDSRGGDVGTDGRRLPVDGARADSVISGRGEFVEVSGSESDLTLALGGYAYALASVVLHNPVPGIGPLEGLDVTDVATGVFDFSIKVSPGRVVVVLIPLLREATQPSPVYKFMEGEWDEFAVVNADRVYSAPAPCPSSNAGRQPDGEAFDPDQHAWRSANDGVREGDRCLLMQIQDGGANDADGTANGVIHDPNALAVGLPPLEPVIGPMMGTVSARSSAEVTVSTRPEIMDSDRRVRITLTLELEPTTATVSVKFRDPDRSSEDDGNVGDGGEFTVELTSDRKTQGLILENASGDPVEFSFAAAPSCEGCGGVGAVGRRGGGGGSMDPIWLIPLALGLLLPHVQRRRRRTSSARH